MSALLIVVCFVMVSDAAAPKNVIVFIGDGMGPNHVIAGRMLNGGPLSFDSFPVRGKATTRSADKEVTDSAASATAISAGVKVNNGVIALAIPGDDEPLPTMLEYFDQQGKWVGLVSDDAITGATPASFAAHVPNRGLSRIIGKQYLQPYVVDGKQLRGKVNVMIGGGTNGLSKRLGEEYGYTYVLNRDDMFTKSKEIMQSGKEPFFAAVFGKKLMPYLYHDRVDKKNEYGNTLPYLREMTMTAVDLLDDNPKGFFLMVESSHTDKTGHAISTRKETRIGCNSTEVVELSKAVAEVLKWAKGRDDTLIVITADHETGGMEIVKDNGPGKLATVTWAHTSHTAADVDVFAYGPGAELFKGKMDNTDIYKKIAKLCEFNKVTFPEVKE